MAADAVGALREAFAVRRPSSIAEAAPAFGGERTRNAEMAEILLSSPSWPRSSRGARATRSNTLRWLQRHQAGQGKQTRTRIPPERQEAVDELLDRARDLLEIQRHQLARRRGFKVRVCGEIRYSGTTREGCMPGDVSGVPQETTIPPDRSRPIVDLWELGERDNAGADLLHAFWGIYWEDDESDDPEDYEDISATGHQLLSINQVHCRIA